MQIHQFGSKDEVEKVMILKALACSYNETILQNYLNLTFEQHSKINNASTVFQAVYSSDEVGLNVALDFIVQKSHITLLQSVFLKYLK